MTNEEKIKILREIEKQIDKANERFGKNIGENFHEFAEKIMKGSNKKIYNKLI